MNRTIALSLSVVVGAAALAAGCQQDKPQWSGKGAAERPMGSIPAASGDVEARLARVEKKLDKITGFLKQAVRPELDTKPTYAVPVDPLDPIIGPKDAKVTIVEAYEFLCPYCNMIAPTMEKIVEAYPNDVRVVPKYLVIHGPPALPSGLAMCAAGKQGKAHRGVPDETVHFIAPIGGRLLGIPAPTLTGPCCVRNHHARTSVRSSQPGSISGSGIAAISSRV